MKVIILIIIFVISLFAMAAGYDMYAGPQLVAVENKQSVEYVSLGKAPEFSFETIDGKKHSITDFNDKIVVVNFWATWCPTCLTEFPDKLKTISKYDGDIILLALSSDNNVADINRFIEKQDKEIRDIIDSNFVYVSLDEKRKITHDMFLTDRYPESIVINYNGDMIRKIVGGVDWRSDEMIEYFNQLVSTKN